MEKIANAKNDQELSAFWNDVKGQDEEKVRRLKKLVKNHVTKNVSNLIGPLSRMAPPTQLKQNLGILLKQMEAAEPASRPAKMLALKANGACIWE